MSKMSLLVSIPGAALLLAGTAAAAQGPHPAASGAGLAQRVTNALAAIEPAVRIAGREQAPSSIEELMRRHKVPGVSVAVVHGGKVAYAKAFGLADAASGDEATVETLFQAASISKPVAATAALAMADAGLLRLDAPVNEQLKSWRIPDSEVASGSSVTLRHLLTHTGGLTAHGFGGYAAGAPLLSVQQILDGTAPANSDAVRIALQPGSQWRYSGGGFVVAQLLMTDVSGSDFPQLMERLVLDPAGMSDSTYRQPLPRDLAEQAAAGHKGDGTPIPGRFNTYPEMAAAGLWTTPTDLARWVIDLSSSYNGKDGVLRAETARMMLTPGEGDFGLGLPILVQGESMRITHSGVNEGFRALMIGYPKAGEGLVIMTNGDNGSNLFGPLDLAIAKVLGWDDVRPRTLTPAKITRTERAAIVGRYAADAISVVVALRGDRIIATQAGSGTFELIPMGNDIFAAPDIGMRVQFARDAKTGRVTSMSAGGLKLPRTR